MGNRKSRVSRMNVTPRSVAVTVAITTFLFAFSFTSSTSSSATSTARPGSSAAVELQGTLVTAKDGTQVVFQRAESPRGAILFFHGCSHSATDFFPAGTGCHTCLGLPEELHLVHLALSRGYSAITLSSTNRRHKCWQSGHAGESPDYDRVTSALEVAQKHGAYSPSQPLYTSGASSGGFFATSLPARFNVKAAHAIVASAAHPDPTIPHAFTHMGLRDKRTAARVKHNIQGMQRRNVPTLEFSVDPLPINDAFLKAAFPHWNSRLITEVKNALVKNDIIDAGTGLLRLDPRRSNWRDAVQYLGPELKDSFVADQSPLSEELNRAWGAHEMTADHFEKVLDFFETNTKNQ